MPSFHFREPQHDRLCQGQEGKEDPVDSSGDLQGAEEESSSDQHGWKTRTSRGATE